MAVTIDFLAEVQALASAPTAEEENAEEVAVAKQVTPPGPCHPCHALILSRRTLSCRAKLACPLLITT